MKTTKTYIYSLATAALFTLVASACKDDILTIDDDSSGWKEEVTEDTYYLGLRIYNAASIEAGSTRADDPLYDGSEIGDYTTEGKTFNLGSDGENKIFTGYTSRDDCPNFLLVFEKTEAATPADTEKLEFLLPLFDWDLENEDKTNGTPEDYTDSSNTTTTSGYNSYKTFYTSAQKSSLPASFADRKVLVVLNASSNLCNVLKSSVGTTTYEDIVKLKIGSSASTDASFLSYHNGGTDYLTMSSSMVVPLQGMSGSNTALTANNTYGPSIIKRNLTWYPTKDEAAKLPIFSFFLERLQSKYTLNFKIKREGHQDYIYYFGDNSSTGSDSGEGEGGVIPHTYSPQQHFMVVANTDFTPASKWEKLYYVNNYTMRKYGETYDPNYVQDFIHEQTEWKINITGWNVNGTEREEYLFKQLTGDYSYYDTSLTGKEWNPVYYSPYRNFWGEDPYYTTRNIPDQYRQAPGITPWSEGVTLNYYNFTQLSLRNTHQYTAENTYDPVSVLVPEAEEEEYAPGEEPTEDELKAKERARIEEYLTRAYKSKGFMRAGNHIIVTAQLLIKGMDDDVWEGRDFYTDGTIKAGTDKYCHSKYYMNDIFWREDAYLNYVIEYLAYWMQKDEETFGHNDGWFYKAPSSEVNTKRYMTQADFTTEPLLGYKGADNYVHAKPFIDQNNLESYDRLEDTEDPNYDAENDDNNIIIMYSYNPDIEDEDEDEEVQEEDKYSPITVGMFEKLALAHPEFFAQHFNRGRMYYAIPVTHYLTVYDNDALSYLGKYGSVRNHWYNYTINNFSAPGTPVSVVTQPIVPNNENSYETLGITLSILPWHVVEANVDISGQRPNITPDLIDVDLYSKINDWNYSPDELGEEDGF